MKQYFTPMLLTNLNGSIDITDSQQGAWGGGSPSTDYSSFQNWFNSDPDVQANLEFFTAAGFNINDPTTWDDFGVDPIDPNTWYNIWDHV